MYKKNIVILVFLLLFVSGCARFGHQISLDNKIILTQDQQKNINLSTTKSEIRELALSIEVPGQFKTIPAMTNRIYAPIDGKITKVFVKLGETVGAHQPLVEMQSDAIGQIQSELLQNIIQINAQIKMSNAQLEFARNNYRRETTLLGEKVTSKRSWEDSKTQLTKESANLSALGAQRTSLVSVYQQRLNLYGADRSVINRVIATNKIYPYIILRSQHPGIIIKRDANLEEFVETNKEHMEVSDLKKVWASGYLFEKDISKVKVGEKVVATINDDLVADGKLTYIASTLDPKTKTLEVVAEINNPELLIKPNMYTKMKINTGTVKALVVPKSAIQKFGDSDLIYVKIGANKFEERKIQTGMSNDQYVEVTKGIKPGETIVTEGSFSLLGESIKRTERD